MISKLIQAEFIQAYSTTALTADEGKYVSIYKTADSDCSWVTEQGVKLNIPLEHLDSVTNEESVTNESD